MSTNKGDDHSCQPSIIMLALLICNLLGCAAQEVKQGYNPNPSDITTVLFESSQYFFVPVGSFLQFSLSNWPLGFIGAYIEVGTHCPT